MKKEIVKCIVCTQQFKDIPDEQGCNVCDVCNARAERIDQLNRAIERYERHGNFDKARELTIELLEL